jgi:iduronate 2-sulfatase
VQPISLPFVFVWLTVLVATPAAAGPEKVKVFLLAGQSNMDGRGQKADLVGPLAKWAQPQSDVLIAYSDSTLRGPYTSGGFKPLEPGYSVTSGARERLGDAYKLPASRFGPEVSFGRTIADGLPGTRIAIIKFSEGGTSLEADWAPDKNGGLYEQCLAFVRKSLKALTDGGATVELAGIVWHQGESDYLLPPGKYQQLLTDFIARLRKDLSSPEVPFVIGDLVDNGTRDAVRAGQLATSQAVPAALFVSAKGLTTVDKDTHFDSASQIEIGRRMAEAWLTYHARSSPPKNPR